MDAITQKLLTLSSTDFIVLHKGILFGTHETSLGFISQ